MAWLFTILCLLVAVFSAMHSEKLEFWALVYLLVIPECLFLGAPSPQVLLVHQVVLFLPEKGTRLSVTTDLKM